MAILNKTMSFEVKEINEEDRIIRFIGSTETPDREGDIIEALGWELDNYKQNPVFLFAHDYRQLPIGQAVDVFVDKSKKQLIFDIKFATAEEYEFADTVYKLYKGKFMRAVSVGFIGKEWEDRYEAVGENRSRWVGRTFKRQELLELSAVPVPCNPDALSTAKSAGLIDVGFEKYFERGSNLAPNQNDIAGDVVIDINDFLESSKCVKNFVREDLVKRGREIMRQCGGVVVDYDAEVVMVLEQDTDDVQMLTFESLRSGDAAEEKAGASLNKKNKAALKQAHELIKTVLDSAQADEEGAEGEGGKGAPTPAVKNVNEEDSEIDLDAIVFESDPQEKGLDDIDPQLLAQAISEVLNEKLMASGIKID